MNCARVSEMLVAADALAKNPANVIPIWIVDKKLPGDFKTFFNKRAFLFPFSASIFILDLFTDTIAISAAAKNALIKIRTNIRIIFGKILGLGSIL